MGAIFEWLLEWFLQQQSPLVVVWEVVAVLLMLIGLWKTFFPGEKRPVESQSRLKQEEVMSATEVAEDIHIVDTQQLPPDGYVYTSEHERVSELAADVFNEEYDPDEFFGEEYEAVEEPIPVRSRQRSRTVEEPVPVQQRQWSPRTVQPRYPTQELPPRQFQPQRPSPRPVQSQSVRQRSTHSVQPQPTRRRPTRPVEQSPTRRQSSPRSVQSSRSSHNSPPPRESKPVKPLPKGLPKRRSVEW